MVTHLIMKLLRNHQFLSLLCPHRYYLERLLYVSVQRPLCNFSISMRRTALWSTDLELENSVINFFFFIFSHCPNHRFIESAQLHTAPEISEPPVKSAAVLNVPPSGIAVHRPPPCLTRCMSRWPDKQTISAPLTAQSLDSCGMRGELGADWLVPSPDQPMVELLCPRTARKWLDPPQWRLRNACTVLRVQFFIV